MSRPEVGPHAIQSPLWRLLTGKPQFSTEYPTGSRMTMRPEPYLNLWNEKTFAGLAGLRKEAEKPGVSMAGLAMAWVMSNPRVTAPIVGPRRFKHFEPILEALALELAEDERGETAALVT